MKNIMLILLGLLIFNNAFSQKEALKIFDSFVNHKWTGHYVNSEDSALVHYISWEYDLDSNYVKQIKDVPEVSFKMETYYYWDYEKKQISSITFINKAMLSKGYVEIVDNKIVRYYKTFFTKGYSESKQTFEISDSHKLIDHFYRKKIDGWVQGHLIEYK